MRGVVWILPMILLLAACQRGEEATQTQPAAPLPRAPNAVAPDVAGTAAVGGGDALPLLSAVAAAAPDPGSVVRDYATHLLRREFDKADAAWGVAPAPGRADDAALRDLRDVVSLKVITEPPIARDQQQPTRLIEVPVQIRVVTGSATTRYHGWYRLVPDADRSAWQIHAAQLQPILD